VKRIDAVLITPAHHHHRRLDVAGQPGKAATRAATAAGNRSAPPLT
jgi:hypothetical protein